MEARSVMNEDKVKALFIWFATSLFLAFTSLYLTVVSVAAHFGLVSSSFQFYFGLLCVSTYSTVIQICIILIHLFRE